MASKKSLTVRDLLNGGSSDFDPLNLDTTEIRELSNLIPSSGEIDINQAEILATKFLRGSDQCSELIAIATCYVSKLETCKKKAYSEAALVKATTAGIKTDKSRCLYSESDPDYIEACNKYSEGLAFLKWITSKYDSLIRAHYLMKRMLDRYYNGEKAASFNTNTDKVIEWESKEDNDDFGKEW